MATRRLLAALPVFDTTGDCVEVFPGQTGGPTDGIWTLEWLVTSRETSEEAVGLITFRVGPGDPPVTTDGGDDDSIDFLLIAVLAVGAGALAVVVTASLQYLRGRRSA